MVKPPFCLRLGALSLTAQTFEAASVKLSGAAPRRYVAPSGGPGTGDPGRIRYPNTSLQTLLMTAYDVQSFQIAGPAWLNTDA